MKTACEFCQKPIDNRGMAAHIHFRHLDQYMMRFRLNWWIWFMTDRWPPRFEQRQLTRGD